MRYNSESAQVKLMIGGNSVIFEDLKISSGFFFISARIEIISVLSEKRPSVLHLHWYPIAVRR